MSHHCSFGIPRSVSMRNSSAFYTCQPNNHNRLVMLSSLLATLLLEQKYIDHWLTLDRSPLVSTCYNWMSTYKTPIKFLDSKPITCMKPMRNLTVFFCWLLKVSASEGEKCTLNNVGKQWRENSCFQNGVSLLQPIRLCLELEHSRLNSALCDFKHQPLNSVMTKNSQKAFFVGQWKYV